MDSLTASPPNALIHSALSSFRAALLAQQANLSSLTLSGASASGAAFQARHSLTSPLLDSVTSLLDDSSRPGAEEWDWPTLALDSLDRLRASVEKWTWTSNWDLDWAQVTLAIPWYNGILEQVKCYGVQQQRMRAVGRDRVRLAWETISRIQAQCKALPLKESEIINSAAVTLHLAESSSQLMCIQRHLKEGGMLLGGAALQGKVKGCLQRIERNATELELLLVGDRHQIELKSRPAWLAGRLMLDANALRRDYGLESPSARARGEVEREVEMGRRVARMYGVERRVLRSGESAWSRSI